MTRRTPQSPASRCPVRSLFAALALGLVGLAAPAYAGTVKVGSNLNYTQYYGTQNTFANILLNFTGFPGTPGVDLTPDGVSMRPGKEAWFEYRKNTVGMWPESTEDRATWYKLMYHCDLESGKNGLSFSSGFRIAEAPTSDGKGNWTGWLKFSEKDIAYAQIKIRVDYDKADLDEKGIAKHPISNLKIIYPGAQDDDFLSPIFKKRLTGFVRLRFCDPTNMNGRPMNLGLDVPGTQNTYEKEGRGILRATTCPANVQTQTWMGGFFHNCSWGKGVGKGNHFSLWDGKEYKEEYIGIGCLAPCEIEWDVDGRCQFFSCSVGIDHEVDGGSTEPHGNVTFQVWGSTVADPKEGDYKLLAEAKELNSRRPPVSVVADLVGMRKLKLKTIDVAGDGNGHVDILSLGAYLIQKWSGRALPTSCVSSYRDFNYYTVYEGGLAYEHAIRICNDLNADLWLNIPCNADDDYLHNFANLMLYGSDPAGKVYTAADGANPRPASPPAGWHPPLNKHLNLWIENDNEVWNFGYACYRRTADLAKLNSARYDKRSTYEQFAEELKNKSDIIKPHFAAAGRAANLRVVFSNQPGGGWGDHETDITLSYMEKKYGPVNAYFDYYAEAPYFSPSYKCHEKSTLDEAFMENIKDLDAQINETMPRMAKRAAKWKLGVTSYEGGNSWYWSDKNKGSKELYMQARNNRRMGMWYDRYLKAWQDTVGKDAVYQQYSIFSNGYGPVWPFGSIEYCAEGLKGSVTYDALLRAAHPAGDADLDQQVDFEDL